MLVRLTNVSLPFFLVDDELVKVVRSPRNSTMPANCHQEFDENILSPVRFTAMTKHPALETVIPSRVWNSSIHRCYPEIFRVATKEILLCSNASYEQPVKAQPSKVRVQVNIAAMLPRVLWMEIMSYTHRDWFEAPQSEVGVLRGRLAEEQANSQRANTRRLEAEARCHIVERERDVYRLLARRWQSRLDYLLNQRDGDSVSESESVADAAAYALLGGREQVAILGFGGMFRRFRNRSTAYESSDDDDEDDFNQDIEVSEQNERSLMEEDVDSMNEDMFEDDDGSLSTGGELPLEGAGRSVAQHLGMSTETAKVISSRPQVRTVSISGPDV
jgi:hypothetical protein